MVAQLCEDGEEALTCVKVEGTKFIGKLKKSGTDGLASNDRGIYSAVCCAQSNDGQAYIGVGKLNGRPVKALRDMDCTGMIVDRALVPDMMVIRPFRLVADSGPYIDRCAIGQCLDYPYYKGQCRVMCVSSSVNPVIVGNVRGA